jgi:hypothetical protein
MKLIDMDALEKELDHRMERYGLNPLILAA